IKKCRPEVMRERHGRREERDDTTDGCVEMRDPREDRHQGYSRRSAFGNEFQTGTPQKCEPSVHRGDTILLRSTHGGPRKRPSCGWIDLTCVISSIDAR